MGAICLALVLLLGACREQETANEDSPVELETAQNGTSSEEVVSAAEQTAVEVFSDRDFETQYDAESSAVIVLNGDSAECVSDAVQISGTTVTITDEGTYILSGNLDDGMIIVDSEKTDKTQLVLNGVTIHSETSAPIYVLQSDKVFITMAAGTTNTLSNGGTFTAIDENNIDAVIFSKEDVTLNGTGTLAITSPGGHGIVSKDSLTITSGTYAINCASHGLAGKDDVSIADGEFTIISGKDGIHAENADDAALGSVFIEAGTFDLTSEGDGISAAASLLIEGGSFRITTGGGSVNAAVQTSENWGGFLGGGGHQGGKSRGSMAESSNAQAAAGEDSTSIKGIKAGTGLTIQDGVFVIDSADDAVHSNASLTVCGGEFSIASGDDGFHADETLTILAGTIEITESYEGLEGLHVAVSGGDITLTASDDGLNAAGGTDQSGKGGLRGGDQFGGSYGSIVISGGTLRVTASGDGLDANGTLEISGGCVTVCGPTQGDTATLDYDVSGVITGGTFIGTGASNMAQTFSGSEQGVISVSFSSQSAGTEIQLIDGDGNTLLKATPELSFDMVILSSPEIVKGETYTIAVGGSTGAFTAK